MPAIPVRPAQESDRESWLEMRLLLWPDGTPQDFEPEMTELLERGHAFVALEEGVAVGFAEVSLRPYAEGCDSSPVAFLEGWFVRQSHRGQGVGRALVQRVEHWGLEMGCTELGSDTLLEWDWSHKAHAKVGFEEVERLVCFRKSLEG